MLSITRVEALALICGTVALAANPARADNDTDQRMHETRNPGFVYRIENGSSPGSIVVTLKNDTGVVQRVFREDPGNQDEFFVVDQHHRRVRGILTPPLGLSVSSRGTTLQPGDSVASTLDLAKRFVLSHGERYTVRARGYVGYDSGNSSAKTFTYINSNQLTFMY